MKIGDLVQFQSIYEDVREVGLVMAMSKTGHNTESAQVLFSDGQTWWVGTHRLEVIDDESR